MAIDGKKLEKWFGPESVPGREFPRIADLRADALRFANSIILNSPASADQSHAIRHVRDALQSAAQAVIFDEQEIKQGH